MTNGLIIPGEYILFLNTKELGRMTIDAFPSFIREIYDTPYSISSYVLYIVDGIERARYKNMRGEFNVTNCRKVSDVFSDIQIGKEFVFFFFLLVKHQNIEYIRNFKVHKPIDRLLEAKDIEKLFENLEIQAENNFCATLFLGGKYQIIYKSGISEEVEILFLQYISHGLLTPWVKYMYTLKNNPEFYCEYNSSLKQSFIFLDFYDMQNNKQGKLIQQITRLDSNDLTTSWINNNYFVRNKLISGVDECTKIKPGMRYNIYYFKDYIGYIDVKTIYKLHYDFYKGYTLYFNDTKLVTDEQKYDIVKCVSENTSNRFISDSALRNTSRKLVNKESYIFTEGNIKFTMLEPTTIKLQQSK